MALLAAALTLLLALPSGASAREKPAQAPAAAGGRYIVVYERGVGSVAAETAQRERARGFHSRLRFRHALRGFAASLSGAQVRELRADPEVAAVVPDRTLHALAAVPLTAGEPLPPTGSRRIGAATASTVRQAASVSVAVVDSGIDLTHPDLNAADGTDCVAPGTTAQDDNGHGTHVAGVIGAENDGAGVAGVAPGTRVYAVKVLGADGDGPTSQVICGLDWVLAHREELNIGVVNMSLGGLGVNDRQCGSTNGDVFHQAVCRVSKAGVLNVVAAGNEEWDISEAPVDVPASYPEVLTVSAMGDGDGLPGGAQAPGCTTATDDSVAGFSNFTKSAADAAHMIAAPGVCIRSTWPLSLPPAGGYRTLSGTSMAAPHVAAAAALCMGEGVAPGPCAGLTPSVVIERLRADAAAYRAADPASGFAGDPLTPMAGDPFYGFLAHLGPDTAISSGPAGTTRDPEPEFAFSSGDVGVVFQCAYDGPAWSPCTSPVRLAPQADGPHRFEVRALDAAGNVDASPAARSFVLDTTPLPPPPPPPSPPPPPDLTAPTVSVGISGQRLATVLRNGLSFRIRCSEACALASRVLVGGSEAGRRASGLSDVKRTVVLRLKTVVRRRLARQRSVLVQLNVVATDAAGNASATFRRSLRLRR